VGLKSGAELVTGSLPDLCALAMLSAKLIVAVFLRVVFES
jgi:hypothetical protein